MNFTRPRFAIPICLAALCAFVHAAGVTFTLPPETARLKPAPGAELAASQCLLCHSADYIATQPRLSRAVWKSEVVKMRQKYGAPIPTNSIDEIVDYLAKNYVGSPGTELEFAL